MKKNYHQKEVDKNDILETLIRLPKKNIETRIKQLSNEIKARQKLRNGALSGLSTHQTQLREKLWQLRYISVLNEGFIVNRDIIRQVINLEEQKIKEITSCFKDISLIRGKIREAKEELEEEKQKLRLLDMDIKKTENHKHNPNFKNENKSNSL